MREILDECLISSGHVGLRGIRSVCWRGFSVPRLLRPYRVALRARLHAEESTATATDTKQTRGRVFDEKLQPPPPPAASPHKVSNSWHVLSSVFDAVWVLYCLIFPSKYI